MPRVVGIDPGTVSLDVCGLIDGELWLDRSWPTADALADPAALVRVLTAAGPLDLVAGPSGYGLPLRPAKEATDAELRLAFLAPPGETGGIGGLRGLARELARSELPMVYTPGVIHLDTVPDHRKLNRIDLGTADKLCVAALGIEDQRRRTACRLDQVSFILIELGGAFTAAVAVRDGQVVDGVGGSSGPLGWQGPGALDGEVAFLAGEVSKAALFRGGVDTVATEWRGGSAARGRATALDGYVEGAVKTVRQLLASVPAVNEVLLSGRRVEEPGITERLETALRDVAPVRRLGGIAGIVKQGAQGAALIADGLSGGRHRDLVDRLRIREARGTVLDHLYFVRPEDALRRLGLSGG